MKYKIYWLQLIMVLFFSSFVLNSNSQTSKASLKFNSLNSVGLLNGESSSTFTMQTINGISFKKVFAGIGVAIDNYGYRTIPVFLDIRKTFGNRSIQPLLFADLGIGYHVKTEQLPEKWWNGMRDFTIKNSFCGEWGLGLEKKSGTSSFYVTASYSLKKYAFTQNDYWDIGPQGTTLNRFDYSYNRVVLRMGVRL